MASLVFVYHQDPGHGWLEVSREDLTKLALTPKSFSRYSYRDRLAGRFYLEEDCDMPMFLYWYKQINGFEPEIVSSHKNAHCIRNMPHIWSD